MWPFQRNDAHAIRSAQPFWMLRNGIGDAGATLDRALECDIAIIGAGITGALVADALVSTGQRIVVLDRIGIARGSTAATTALLQYEIDTPLVDLAQMLGAERAARAYGACVASISMLERRFPELLPLADYERRESVYLASTERDVPKMRTELAARRGMGIACQWLEADEVRRRFGCRSPGAIVSALGAQLDPVRFTRGLLASCVRHGVDVYERVTVESLDVGDQRLIVRTQAGHAVSARHVVVCAGYESLEFLDEEVAEIDNTFALVTESLADPARAAALPLIWESARPYLYVRGTRDGRIIVGGADLPFKNAKARDLLLPRQMRRIAAQYEDLFGAPLPPVAYGWAGSFARTPDGLPFIGHRPGGNPRLHLALCFGGNGITYSVHAAEMIRAHVEGRPHELDDVFGFGRNGDIPRFLANGDKAGAGKSAGPASMESVPLRSNARGDRGQGDRATRP